MPLSLVSRLTPSAVLLLFALPASGQADFHTPPNCWAGPRIFHSGPPPANLAARVQLVNVPASPPAGDALPSPNGAYRLWIRQPDATVAGPWSGGLIVDRERDTFAALMVDQIAQPLAPRWVNEKLIFVRVAWGRVMYSDLLWDVESHKLAFHELAQDGTNAFARFQEDCAGTCPCAPPDTVAGPLPVSRPGPDTGIGLLALPGLLGAGSGQVPADEVQPVAVYAEPAADRAPIAQIRARGDVDYAEIGYEEGAAVVYAVQAPWYQVRPGRRPSDRGWVRGWVQAADPVQFHGNASLLTNRLGYLNRHWTGDLWSAPDATGRRQRSGIKRDDLPGRGQQYPADIVEARETEHGLWVKVALYAQSPCAGGSPQPVEEGWVPAYSADGERTLWYWSRGC